MVSSPMSFRCTEHLFSCFETRSGLADCQTPSAQRGPSGRCAALGHDPTGTVPENDEVEPWGAVDLTASPATSTDGGATWRGETFADFSRCPLFAQYGDPAAQEPGYGASVEAH